MRFQMQNCDPAMTASTKTDSIKTASTRTDSILCRLTLVAALFVAGAGPAAAQSGGLLDGLFSGGQQQSRHDQTAQMSGSDLVVRLDRLEGQIRQLTGAIEQLQYRNQQLEQQLKRAQDDTDYRFQEQGAQGARGGVRPQAVQPGQPAVAPPRVQQPPSAPPTQGGGQRRGDAFDPAQAPEAPGVPRTLGSPHSASTPDDEVGANIGAPGGRSAGAPLDLSTMAGAAAADPALAPPATYGAQNAPVAQAGMQVAAVEPPSQSPKDHFDLGYGYILRREYAQAEQTMRGFLERYPNDSRRADAEYWLGESLFQRQLYRDAATSFLTVSTKYETAARAPDSLLRLGQSLAALGEKETACATFNEVGRKYPKAAAAVRQGAERELKRVRC